MSSDLGGRSPYGAIGGREFCLKLSTRFYGRVMVDPVLRPLFPGKTLKCAIEELAAYLAQLLGGPSEDTQRRWWLSLRESHMRFNIGPAQRTAWMKNMTATLDEIDMDDSDRAALLDLFEGSSRYLVNTDREALVELDNASDTCELGREIRERWHAQLQLDDLVGCIRSCDVAATRDHLEDPVLRAYLAQSPTAFIAALALMIRSRNEELLRFVADTLSENTKLVEPRQNGRTLLHDAAASGVPTLVSLLLRLGSNANAASSAEYGPLYSVANECTKTEAPEVVQLLLEAGADVNHSGGVTRGTALHAAARRGNTNVVKALIDAGADLEARDARGDTPLRRAVNCKKAAVAELLVTRGADIHSVGQPRAHAYRSRKN